VQQGGRKKGRRVKEEGEEKGKGWSVGAIPSSFCGIASDEVPKSGISSSPPIQVIFTGSNDMPFISGVNNINEGIRIQTETSIVF
jgi:hypothetical protein